MYLFRTGIQNAKTMEKRNQIQCEKFTKSLVGVVVSSIFSVFPFKSWGHKFVFFRTVNGEYRMCVSIRWKWKNIYHLFFYFFGYFPLFRRCGEWRRYLFVSLPNDLFGHRNWLVAEKSFIRRYQTVEREMGTFMS